MADLQLNVEVTVIERIRTRALWMAIGLVLGTAAIGFAAAPVGVKTHGPKATPTVTASPSADADDADEAEEQETEKADEDQQEQSGEHPENHGFFVSQAAHCVDVSADVEDVTFPEDCSGKAKGQYVSSVARSKAGKGEHGKPHSEDEDSND